MAEPNDLGKLDRVITHDDGGDIRFTFYEPMQISHSHDGSNAHCVVTCKFEDMARFLECLHGFAEIKVDGALRTLHRSLPLAYHAGFSEDGGGGTFSKNDWLYCTNTEIQGDGLIDYPGDVIGFDYFPWYKYAQIKCTFNSLLYEIKTDEDVVFDVEGPDDEYREWLRYCIVNIKAAGTWRQDTQIGYKWVDDQKLLNLTPPFWDAYSDITVKWFEVPWNPIYKIWECLGKVNEFTFLKGIPGVPNGLEPETALLVGADIIQSPRRMARKYWDVTYAIRRVKRKTSPGSSTIAGHNHFSKPRFKVSEGVYNGRKYVRISVDGTNSALDGNSWYDWTDLNELFAVPSAGEI